MRWQVVCADGETMDTFPTEAMALRMAQWCDDAEALNDNDGCGPHTVAPVFGAPS